MTEDDRGDPGAVAGEPTDPDLITAVRAGDMTAYAILYRRHIESARRMSRHLVRDPSDVDDLVAESFAKLLSTLRAGGGPSAAFRPYLLTTIRNLFYDGTRRARRVQVTDDLSAHDAGVPFVDTAVQGLEHSLVARAFARLPERWQVVLWHTEVEGEGPTDVAPLLGLTPNGVAALAYRARERLRQHYLQEHIAAEPDHNCQWAIERLGAYVRSGLSRRDSTRVDDHLSGCARCHVLFVELADVNAGLGAVLAPAVLAGSAAGYAVAGGTATTGGGLLFSIRQIARRRSTQAAAVAAVILAALVALAMALTSQPTPLSPPEAAKPPQAGQPPPEPVEPPPAPPSPPPTVPTEPPVVPPLPTPAPGIAALIARLEPVGALVRDRPGVLAMTVQNAGPARPTGGTAAGGTGTGGTAARGTAAGRGFGPAACPTVIATSGTNLKPDCGFAPETAIFERQRLGAAPDTGPLTAFITVPSGVTLRAGVPSDGWRCVTSGGIRCDRATLPSGATTRAYLPVAVSATAADGVPTVRLIAPHATVATAAAPTGIRTGGLAAVVAGTMPATVTLGGNSLLSCPTFAFGCAAARTGRKVGDNGDFYMTRYVDPAAPVGVPYGAMVSGADIAVPGSVVWAGLYWAGSGTPPATPTARLRVPGTAGFAAVQASRVDRVSGTAFSQTAYQASADVTALVRDTPGGRWWVAVDAGAFALGHNAFGGWSLVVVVNDGGPARTVAVFDGFTPLTGTQSFSSAVFGTAGGAARVGLIAWEGDRSIVGDGLRLGDQALDASNVAASRANGTPDGWHTFGVDARLFDGRFPVALAAQTVTASTAGDAWLLGVVSVVTPAGR